MASPTLQKYVRLCMMLCLMAGCKRADMYTQADSRSWDSSNFFAKAMTMQAPPAGSVARDAPDPPAPQPKVATVAMLARGQERYDIFCASCHAADGGGNGMIVQRGFPAPPSFHTQELREAKASYFYDAITKGYGKMYSFAERLSPADRWAVIAYVRALQLSQNTPADRLSPQDRAHLIGGS